MKPRRAPAAGCPCLFRDSGCPPAWSVCAALRRRDAPPAPVYWREWDGEGAWIFNTYIQLRRRGIDARLVDRFQPGGLCVASYDTVTRLGGGFESYVVCARMDRAVPRLCDETIVQNRSMCGTSADHFVPHWLSFPCVPDDVRRANVGGLHFTVR